MRSYSSKNTQAIIRDFSLADADNLDIITVHNRILELLTNIGFKVTSRMSSAGVSDTDIVVENLFVNEHKTEKRSGVNTDQDSDSKETIGDKNANVKVFPKAGLKKKLKAVVEKAKPKRELMTYSKTKEFVLGNLQLLKRIFKEHIPPAAISLLKNEAVMLIAIRQTYHFLPPESKTVISQETYVVCMMASKNLILNYITT